MKLKNSEEETQEKVLLSAEVLANIMLDQNVTETIRKYIEEDNPKEMRILVEAYEDAALFDKEGMHPVHYAASKGATACLQEILNIDKTYSTLPTKSGRTTKGTTPINLAIWMAKLDAVEILLENGASINQPPQKTEEMLLFPAIAAGKIELVKLLIEKGINVNTINSYDETFLKSLIRFKAAPLPLAQLLWDSEIYEYASGQGLHIAVGQANVGMISLLLTYGANVNGVDSNGWTALHIAAYDGNLDIAALLVAHGADVNASNYKDQTVLHIAAAKGHLPIIKLFLQHGANIEAGANSHGTALVLAAQKQEVDAVKLLIIEGAKVEEIQGKNLPENILSIIDVAKIIRDICSLNVSINPRTIFVLDKMDPNELEELTNDIMTGYLVKNGISEEHRSQLQPLRLEMPDKLKNPVSKYFNKLIANTESDLQIIEAELLAIEFKIPNVPFSLVQKGAALGDEIKKTDEQITLEKFYNQNAQYKNVGSCLLHQIATPSPIEGLNLLNYIMILDERISNLVITLNDRVLDKTLKDKLTQIITNHESYQKSTEVILKCKRQNEIDDQESEINVFQEAILEATKDDDLDEVSITGDTLLNQ